MEPAEIEEAIGELETRMDRLRALYDQYFMGIERLEPMVPRKDVERRMALLRKEQIRNSGLRYKFNMLAQRFSTNQTHWMRIARQIENGTYRRDVRRAKARFGVDPTKEGADVPAGSQKERPSEREEAPASPPRFHIPDEPAEEMQNGNALLQPVDLDDDPFGGLGAHEVPVARERFASSLRLDIDELGQPLEEDDPFPKATVPSSGPKIRPRAPSMSGEARVTIAKRASIPDSGEVAASPPSRPGPPPPPPSRPGAPAPLTVGAPLPRTMPRSTLPGAGAPPLPPGARRKEVPTLTSANSPVISEVQSELQRRMTLQGPGLAPEAPAERPAPAAAAPPPPGPAVKRREAPTLTSSNTGPSPLGDAQKRVTLPHGAPLPSTVTVTVPVAGSAPRVVQRPPTLSGTGFPQLEKPPPAVPPSSGVSRVAPSPRAAPPAPAPSRPSIGDLSGDRFDQIHSKYLETRRAQNEPTHAITREALAKQLTDATARVKQKHGDKAIDFEVVVKDGKTILRPVVK